MKQTAVEWLENQMKTSKYFYNLMEDINSRSTVTQSDIFEQAKEMEKEQIIDAWLSAWKDSMLNPLEDKYYQPEAEQYYNETFKSE